ncbi:hypothetical protein ACPFL9_09335 [Paenarthrobacter sp. NyZ202]|uniref:hypothetical protein n=1 Tax=Paenarthrobacter sp. NyZ202 TaxID=3402689 RepID=UPI003CEBC237
MEPKLQDIARPGNALHLMASEHWAGLEGRYVELRQADGTVVDLGWVEAVSNDGKILWFSFEGVTPRRLHLRLAGIETWVSEEEVFTQLLGTSVQYP